jgi:hypothetical protein
MALLSLGDIQIVIAIIQNIRGSGRFWLFCAGRVGLGLRAVCDITQTVTDTVSSGAATCESRAETRESAVSRAGDESVQSRIVLWKMTCLFTIVRHASDIRISLSLYARQMEMLVRRAANGNTVLVPFAVERAREESCCPHAMCASKLCRTTRICRCVVVGVGMPMNAPKKSGSIPAGERMCASRQDDLVPHASVTARAPPAPRRKNARAMWPRPRLTKTS